jgi:hypothetical protein
VRASSAGARWRVLVHPLAVCAGCFQPLRSILTEIYLCHTCSCRNIEDGNARTGPLGCGQHVPRGAVSVHTEQRCPERVVRCGWWELGCHTAHRQRELSAHEDAAVAHHLALTRDAATTQASLSAALSQENAELRAAHESATSQLSELRAAHAQSASAAAAQCAGFLREQRVALQAEAQSQRELAKKLQGEMKQLRKDHQQSLREMQKQMQQMQKEHQALAQAVRPR